MQLGDVAIHHLEREVLLAREMVIKRPLRNAGRDETEFPDADAFVIDRNPNRHVSFGVGIHRCPGSHLARITFSEMLSGVLERLPDYHIDPAEVIDYPDWAMVGGWQRMPATFTPTSR